MTARTALRCTLAFVATLLLAPTAHAQLFRAYLAPSPAGNDANPCTLPLPCRLLPAALNAVASGGEIWILDSANYNTATVNVTKSVTILAVPGAIGSVVATGGPAIIVATPGVAVTLRNLVIVPLPGGGGTNGVELTASASLVVDNCFIANHGVYGILLNATGSLRVVGTTVRGNGNTGLQVQAVSAGGTSLVDIAESTLDGNGAAGLTVISGNATATIKASIQNSRIVQNGFGGANAQSNVGASVALSVSNSLVSNNAGGAGLGVSGSGARIWASGNTVTGNALGLGNSGGVLESAGNNAVRNNTGANSGTITLVGAT